MYGFSAFPISRYRISRVSAQGFKSQDLIRLEIRSRDFSDADFRMIFYPPRNPSTPVSLDVFSTEPSLYFLNFFFVFSAADISYTHPTTRTSTARDDSRISRGGDDFTSKNPPKRHCVAIRATSLVRGRTRRDDERSRYLQHDDLLYYGSYVATGIL